jgi:Tfp pilus assembly protein PilF
MAFPLTNLDLHHGTSRGRLWIWAAGALLLGFVVTGSFCWSRFRPSPDIDAARRAVAAGRFQEALVPLERWILARPNSAEAQYLRARVAYALGQPRELRDALERAAALGYPEVPLQRLRGLDLCRAGHYDEAEPILVQVINAEGGGDAEAEEALTRSLLMTYKLDRAKLVIKRWSKDAPQDPKPYLWMTEIDRRDDVGGKEALVEHYRAALRLDSKLNEARLGLAEGLRALHQNRAAAAEYETYLARKPKDVQALVGAGRTALELGEVAATTRYLDRALAIDSKNLAALKERANLDLRNGANADALRRLDDAVRVDPYDAEVAHSRSLVLSRLNRSDEAKTEQQRASRLRRDRAELLETRGKLTSDPNNNELRYQVARWLIGHGQGDEGVRWAKNILASDPAHAATNHLLADYYQRRGDAGLANYYRLQVPARSGEKSSGP